MTLRAPQFWDADDARFASRMLRPFESVTGRVSAARVARPGWRAPVPVICCGNAGVGGAGKTTLALELGQQLLARGVRVHFLTRGYGGRRRGPLRVEATHAAADIGDEPLLLAALAPTWVAVDRAAGAREAVAAGAAALVMDDGLQNPTLAKDLSFLVIDGMAGFGNGRLLPAGPLREPVAEAAARCAAAVLIGDDRRHALVALPPSMPVLSARLVPAPSAATLVGQRVLGFAGIARPEKFFATLAGVGADIVERIGFPDHHAYPEAELRRLCERARRLGAMPVTTAKDAARLTPSWRDQVSVLDVGLAWDDPEAVEALLRRCVR